MKRLIKISDPSKDKRTLFIWPEGILWESYLSDLKKYRNLFEDNFSKNHLILLGITSYENIEQSNEKKYFNSIVILNNKLEILSLYKKINLVPFGEFLPLENILSKTGLKKVTPGYSSFSPGNIRALINLGSQFNDKSILPLICYEIIYTGKIKNKNQSPDLIVNISEDAWFGQSNGPHKS